MATVTITTTPRQDAAAKRMADTFNAGAGTSLTTAQFAQQEIQALINRWVDKTEADQRITKAAAYQIATPDDQATIDAILAKYGA